MSIQAPPRRPRPPAQRPVSTRERSPSTSPSLTANRLPSWAAKAVMGAATLTALALYVVVGLIAAIASGWLIAVLALPLWSLLVEGRRKAIDRLAGAFIASSFMLALIPLISIVWKVLEEGSSALGIDFLTFSMRNVVGEGGGIYHALVGTLLITIGAAVISIPIGLFTSIYLVEYGNDNRLSRWITFLVDVMTGIPSIVAGLFAFALFAVFFGPGVRMGVGGSVALSVLMIPVVVRSCEEMIKLVPAELREAAYALGVPKWRTVIKVVLPTALSGIVTGVTLAIARVIGETAPLLLIAGTTASVNFNMFDGRMQTLPVFAFSQQSSPGAFGAAALERAWGAALVLMIIVMVLNLIARLISGLFSPKR